MEKSFQRFLASHVKKLKPIAQELHSVQWNYDTLGDESLAERKKQLEAAYVRIYLDQKQFNRLQEFRASGKIQDALLQRQLEILLNTYRFHMGDKDHLDRVVQLETEINSIYNHYRGQMDGKTLNNNEIKKILQEETDNARRKRVWESAKQVGAQVADKILELVRLRNESARKSGFQNYYHMSLSCNEMDEKKMFATLERLSSLTEQPFREAKRKLDEQLSRKFRIQPEEMRPWHYVDPFFQEAPPSQVDLNPFFARANIEGLTRKTYQSIGMEIDDILARSSLYPKEGKYQHAYCTQIDPDTKDIRVLCNIDQSEYWAGTMLHEFGHAVYDKYIGDDLPYLLKSPAHTLSTEAMAMMIESLPKEEDWLIEMVQAPASSIHAISQDLLEQERLAQLIFARWGLVMVYFEHDMYYNPKQDLDTLWWDYVEKFQALTRPENRHAPDWASKLHLALAPVYYQNYLYGQMVASQLIHYIQKNVGNGKLFHNAVLGPYLVEKYFKTGSRFDWNRTLELATGESLHPEYYIQETMGIPIKTVDLGETK
jgi:peptidyl-dipeptidase A